ncbi:MAG: hypothetical protein DI585_03490 [Pseudomonas fluorescens]|nr:MAG: hypothetical protein DI585_03490 [Pseudomonas fluorescens]
MPRNLTIVTAALVAATALTACSTFGGGKSEDTVHQIGKDSYTVRTLSERSTSAAKGQALSLANAACQKQSRGVMVTKEDMGIEEGTGERYYDLNFMCLNSGDTDFQRIKRDGQPQALQLQAPQTETTY